jgi:3-oxoacyl-[acyl-carrier protein] reductase
MPSDVENQVALVTGGGRGVGRSIAEELARAGMHVAVAARSAGQVEDAAAAVHGLALELDVTDRAAVEAAVVQVEAGLGPIDVLCANAGISLREESTWEAGIGDWWRIFEVNVLGVHLCCRAVIPGMLERGRGRIVITGSGASYLPGLSGNSAYCASKAAVGRYGEILARELAPHGIQVFVISPGLVRTAMTEGAFGDDAPWTPPECAPRLVLALASGRLDRLSGRYIHAEHDDPDELAGRLDEIVEQDLNAIRLRR